MTNYKCIVTLNNGAHKLVRMTKDVVACLVTAFRKYKQFPWLPKRYQDVFEKYDLQPRQVAKLLFINEYTGEKLEIA